MGYLLLNPDNLNPYTQVFQAILSGATIFYRDKQLEK